MARGRRAAADGEDLAEEDALAQASHHRAHKRYRRDTQDVEEAAASATTQTVDVDEEEPRTQQRHTRGREQEDAGATQHHEEGDGGGEDLLLALTQNIPDEADAESDQEEDTEKWTEWARVAEEGGTLDPDTVRVTLEEQVTSWEALGRFISRNGKILGNVAAFCEEQAHMDGVEQSEHFAIFDDYARKLCDTTAKTQQRIRALKRLNQMVGEGSLAEGLADTFKGAADQLDAKYDAQTSRKKYGQEDNELYTYFRTLTWDAGHGENEPMPALKELLPAEEGDADDSDDDLQMGGVVVSFKCPLTQDYFDKPVRSKTCKHVFSADAIAQHLQNSHAGRCPVSGCAETLRSSELVPDELMAQRTSMHVRRVKSGAAVAAEVID